MFSCKNSIAKAPFDLVHADSPFSTHAHRRKLGAWSRKCAFLGFKAGPKVT